ncbi:MAG: VIT domain-containing protein [Planctomycetes bacterium]|nr:VIT domain-containing protein [Planctomycetota bacterium]
MSRKYLIALFLIIVAISYSTVTVLTPENTGSEYASINAVVERQTGGIEEDARHSDNSATPAPQDAIAEEPVVVGTANEFNELAPSDSNSMFDVPHPNVGASALSLGSSGATRYAGRTDEPAYTPAPVQRGDGSAPNRQPDARSPANSEELVFIPRDREPSGMTRDPEITTGKLIAKDSEGRSLAEFPLKHTDVSGRISGPLAGVSVTQIFENDFNCPIEAVYVFPLSNHGAVNEFVMRVGGRTIRGIVREREEAERLYNQARQQGRTASLLTQERPNIFTQKVANIPAGERVSVEIRYVERLAYDAGLYSFHFPMVVAPRYINGGAGERIIGASQASSTSGDPRVIDSTQAPTSAVPDAHRITPPTLAPGMRSSNEVSLNIEVDAGLPIVEWKCPSHLVKFERDEESPAKAKISLANENGVIANSDFVFQFKTSADRPDASLLTYSGNEGDFFMLTLEPPVTISAEDTVGREMIFVLDCSGSMNGAPITKCKEAIRYAIDNLNPQDTFNILRFSERASGFRNQPVPATSENKRAGLDYVLTLSGQGGTNMIEGIKAALDFEHDSAKMRIVNFMTDGLIGDENTILRAIGEKLRDSRLYSFGIGSSVNRHLLDEMAKVGRGYVTYVRQDENSEDAVERFYSRVRSPALYNVKIEFEGLAVTDVYPKLIPDLFCAQPVVVTGRILSREGGSHRAILSGQLRSETWRKSFPLNVDPEVNTKALAYIWARDKIDDLSEQLRNTGNRALVAQIRDLAVDFQIVSQYTAFVAVDSEGERQSQPSMRVDQPVEMAEGVTYSGTLGVDGGPSDGALILRVPQLGLTLEQTLSGDVVIREIDSSSGLRESRLRVGDSITELGSRRVRGLADVREAQNHLRSGELIEIRASRGQSVSSESVRVREE